MEPVDWRKRPRKPPESVRTVRLSIRVTPAELAKLHALASEARLTLADYVVSRALGERR